MTSPITPYSGSVPNPFTQSQPAFDANTQAFVDYITQLPGEINQFSADLGTVNTNSTSTTSNAIGTGSKAFTVQTGKSYFPGQSVTIARTSAPTNRMFAVVDSYNSGTGALVVTSQAFEGSGTFTDWTITLGFNGVISAGQIASDAVETAKIKDGAITRAKLASDTIPRNYIDGLTLSTAGASTTMTIAAGDAADSTNAVMMTLASAINKTTASWAVGTGNGGLDTGSIANNTWYHFYEIRRPDTGVVDVIFSTNASTPNLPANYTQFRRIGSGLTNGSAQWVSFKQFGNEFYWDAVVADANAANPGTSAVTRTITVPTGVQVLAHISVGLYSGTNNQVAYVSSLNQSNQASVVWNDTTVTNLGATGSAVTPGGAGWGWSTTSVLTNTSAQIRTRNGSSGANDRIAIITNGWTDSRGAQ